MTVYLPPYLVGLKISDWTLAKAEKALVGRFKSLILFDFFKSMV